MSHDRMRDDDIRALGYEPTRKGWVSNRLSGQLNGQLSLLEAKRWSPATVVAYLRLPPSMARTYAVAMALGNGISREGSRASFRGGKDQVASVISGTKRKRIYATLGGPDASVRWPSSALPSGGIPGEVPGLRLQLG